MNTLLLLLYIAVCINVVFVQADLKRSCDRNGIPSYIKVEKNGHAEISCTLSKCFGSANGQLRIRKCSSEWTTKTCMEPTQITRSIKVEGDKLLSKCCHFRRLQKDATTVQTVTLRPGEQYHGGEVFDKRGQMVGFNVVKDVRQIGTLDKGLSYAVSIYHMPCKRKSASKDTLKKPPKKAAKSHRAFSANRQTLQRIDLSKKPTYRQMTALPSRRQPTARAHATKPTMTQRPRPLVPPAPPFKPVSRPRAFLPPLSPSMSQRAAAPSGRLRPLPLMSPQTPTLSMMPHFPLSPLAPMAMPRPATHPSSLFPSMMFPQPIMMAATSSPLVPTPGPLTGLLPLFTIFTDPRSTPVPFGYAGMMTTRRPPPPPARPESQPYWPVAARSGMLTTAPRRPLSGRRSKKEIAAAPVENHAMETIRLSH